jgi:hypothetical protein
VTVWGAAYELGDRFGDDLVLTHCDLKTISVIAEIPSFGEAMAHVGWLVPTDDGGVIFPKYFTEQENPHSKHRNAHAERQARYRAKKRAIGDVTRDVTSDARVAQRVTPREEKRREEKKREERNQEPSLPFPSSLPEGFRVTWEAWIKHRREIKKPLTEEQAKRQLTQFGEWGEERARNAIEHTIRQGWQGLREPDQKPVQKKIDLASMTIEERARHYFGTDS